MADQTTPRDRNGLNLALGVLAGSLALAILGVLFVGVDDDLVASAGTSPATTVADQPTSTTTVGEPATTTAPSTAQDPEDPVFVVPDSLNGEWQSFTSSTRAEFESGLIRSLQTSAIVNGQTVRLSLSEPSSLAQMPSRTQPVQAVLFVTTESDATRSSPAPVLAEFLFTDSGLRLIIDLGGTMVEDVLRPLS